MKNVHFLMVFGKKTVPFGWEGWLEGEAYGVVLDITKGAGCAGKTPNAPGFKITPPTYAACSSKPSK